MNPLHIAILVYIGLVVCLYSFKPKFCFTEDGHMKKFGIGKKKTPFTFLTISIILGLFSFVISLIYNDYVSHIVELLEDVVDVVEV